MIDTLCTPVTGLISLDDFSTACFALEKSSSSYASEINLRFRIDERCLEVRRTIHFASGKATEDVEVSTVDDLEEADDVT